MTKHHTTLRSGHVCLSVVCISSCWRCVFKIAASVCFSQKAAGMSGIVPMPAASVVCRVRRCYFTRPFSRYSARLVRMTAARWSAATFWMSCCTMAGTVVPDGWRRAVRDIDLGDHNIAFDLRGAALTTTTRRISRMLRLTGLLG